MNTIDLIQGSPEWFAARLGKVTASRIHDVVAKTRNGWGSSRANYAAELIAERLTGEVAAPYRNAAMQWGTEQEPDARAAYEFRMDVEVVPVGFVYHPKFFYAGASPDGFVTEHGLIEIKCPQAAGHIDTLLGGSIDGKYIKQMNWQMACTGRHWCDYVSFDPRLPEEMRLFVQRVHRDEGMIKELEECVIVFLAEIDQKVAALTERYSRKAAA